MDANITQADSPEATHIQWQDVQAEMLNPQLERRYVVGSKTMVARIELAKGCIVPAHSHENEQVSYIESGALLFNVQGKEILVKQGELLCLPPNILHSALAVEDTVDIDFFVPPREDWIAKTDLYLR